MGGLKVRANGVEFACLEAGHGPLVLLLHGFPDTAHTFRYQMAALAAAGYRAVAPFQRGFWPSGAPDDNCFQTAALGRDVLALLEALGGEPAAVIGHDWGARAAYAAAALAPDRIRRLVTIAVPYGPRAVRRIQTDYDQLKRWWYHFFFQLPLAEEALADFAFIERIWRDWSPGWEPPAEVLAQVRATFARPGVIAAALAHYRSRWGTIPSHPAYAEMQAYLDRQPPIAVETLYIHGRRDGCIGVEMAEGMAESFPRGLHPVYVDGAGHFAHLERPDVVNAQILQFLGRS